MNLPSLPGPLLVMGAGTIGCYVGGRLAAAGAEVRFVGRARVLGALREHGLTISDLDGARLSIAPAALRLHDAVPAGLSPSLVLLAVKSGATAQAATELATALPPGTPVLSLQNGVSNAGVAQRAAPALRLLPGMVPYNVAELSPGHFYRGTGGRIAAQDDAALRAWQPVFAQAGVPLKLHADLRPIQWGKLLINLNNPVDALSGLPLRAELLERGFRRCFAALIDEALGVLAAAGIAPAQVVALPPERLVTMLRLPTPLFRLLAARMLRIDPKARSSMADDLALGRVTEIDALCGEVVRLAAAHGLRAPRCETMLALLADWPKRQRPYSPRELLSALGL
ncbi:2-dehydropantoate 2-reductase [Caldimonas sp. KR1-144]|uniref:2-dehydropantoate 2-reductase n=1 Tax=Caldimonas sp. KR1-144 TaxID=3400911 RepID=UPI003BFDBBEE